jgi:uncharacterized membrane protein
MTSEDWLLAFHLLAAFALAAALVLFSTMVVVGRRVERPADTAPIFRLSPVGTVLLIGGALLALVLGVALAIDSDVYEISDGWIIAALVLWVVLGFVGDRTGRYYSHAERLSRENPDDPEILAILKAPTGGLLHLATLAVFVLLVLDMIFKPGA